MSAAVGAPGRAADADSDREADPVAAVAAWRAQHPGPVDAVGLSVVEALARRAAAQQGPARQLMLQRVGHLLAGLAAPPPAPVVPPWPEGGLSLLSGLVDRLGREAPALVQPAPVAGTPTKARAGAVRGTGGQGASAPASLKSVTAFKSTWSRLRAEQRLHQAAAQVPGNAGPLHSSQVVYRALRELHTLSPAYLDGFMSHVESLMALEQAAGLSPHPSPGNAAPTTTTASAPPPAGRTRGKARAPRGRGAAPPPGGSTAA